MFHIVHLQSRTQSPLAFWSAGGRQERLWGAGILLPQDFCGKTMQAVTANLVRAYKIVTLIKSTVPVGTTDLVQ